MPDPTAGSAAATAADRTVISGTSSPDGTRYALRPGVHVLRRPDDAVQIGLEPPRSALLHQAPAAAERLLAALDGSQPVDRICRRLGQDLPFWAGVLDQLCDLGLADRVDTPLAVPLQAAAADSEFLSLAHRAGRRLAHVTVQSRSDATVLLLGEPDDTGPIAGLLAEVGVGHVQARRPPEPGRREPPRWWRVRGVDDGRLPDLIIACDTSLTPPAAETLHVCDLPHLFWRTGPAGCTVGPLTLPGRSACHRCLARHRVVRDGGWTTAEAGRDHRLLPSPPLARLFAAGLATAEATAFLDGRQTPRTVDGTVEWVADENQVHRRGWQRHPECECRRVPLLAAARG